MRNRGFRKQKEKGTKGQDKKTDADTPSSTKRKLLEAA